MDDAEGLHITKIAAAKRQLDAAIRMFFIKEDELAIHTVVAASLTILRNESDKRGKNFGERVLQGGLYNMAAEYLNGDLSAVHLELLKASGFIKKIEEIADRIKHDANFAYDQIALTGTIDQRAWPSKVANFLKHADRKNEPPLPADEIKNEVFLMSACAAYLEIIRQPSREMAAYIAFYAIKTKMDVTIDPPAHKLFEELSKLPESDRYAACERFVKTMDAQEETPI